MEPAGDGRWAVRSGNEQHGTFDAVVNALWEGRPAIDRTARHDPDEGHQHRYRVSLFARADRSARGAQRRRRGRAVRRPQGLRRRQLLPVLVPGGPARAIGVGGPSGAPRHRSRRPGADRCGDVRWARGDRARPPSKSSAPRARFAWRAAGSTRRDEGCSTIPGRRSTAGTSTASAGWGPTSRWTRGSTRLPPLARRSWPGWCSASRWAGRSGCVAAGSGGRSGPSAPGGARTARGRRRLAPARSARRPACS